MKALVFNGPRDVRYESLFRSRVGNRQQRHRKGRAMQYLWFRSAYVPWRQHWKRELQRGC